MTAYNLGSLAADVIFLLVVAGVVVGIVYLVKIRSKPASPVAEVPDWYPDPVDPELLRYFDGETWTGATRLRGPPPES